MITRRLPSPGRRFRHANPLMIFCWAALFAGCAAHGGGRPDERWVAAVAPSTPGAVVPQPPILCVGRHAATGGCFTVADPHQLAGLRVGECVLVDVTWDLPSGGPRPRLLSVRPATVREAARAVRADDCPAV